jgi:hypothetical protein
MKASVAQGFLIEEDRFSLADGNVAGAESRPGRKLK